MAILFCYFLVFAIIGMGFFKGSLRQRCFYVTSPDSPATMYENITAEEFAAKWTAAFGELTSAASMTMLSPTLKRVNLSEKEYSSAADAFQLALVREQAYHDNVWKLALPSCGSTDLPGCDELCTGAGGLGGNTCPDVNGSRTVCRTKVPFFGMQIPNPEMFEGWCDA